MPKYSNIKSEAQFQRLCVRSFQMNYPKHNVCLSAALNEASGDKGKTWQAMGRLYGKEDLTISVPSNGNYALCIELKHEKTVFQPNQVQYARDLQMLKTLTGITNVYEVCRYIPFDPTPPNAKWFKERHINHESNEELWHEWDLLNKRQSITNPTWYFDHIVACYMNGPENKFTPLFAPPKEIKPKIVRVFPKVKRARKSK